MTRTFPPTWIQFEGPEGSGKSSLFNNLKTLPYKALTFTEDPSSSRTSLETRALSTEERHRAVAAAAEERLRILRNEIVPALEAGRIVISDQSIWSSLILDGTVLDGDPDIVRQANETYLEAETQLLERFPCKVLHMVAPLDERLARLGSIDEVWHQHVESIYDQIAGRLGWNNVDSSDFEPQMNRVLSLFDAINDEWQLDVDNETSGRFWQQISAEYGL